MIERYLNPKINSIWDDQNKFDTWKLVQEKYVETLEELNVAEKGIAKKINQSAVQKDEVYNCLLYTSPSPRDQRGSRMPSSA